MSNLIQTIEKAKFVATPEQIEHLARESAKSDSVVETTRGTYLKVLLTAMQSQLGQGPRLRNPRSTRVLKPRMTDATIAAHITVLDKVSEPFYAAVLKGVTTSEVEDDKELPAKERNARASERNRRTTFARTSKATISAYIRAGGDVRDLVAAQASKASLRAFVEKKIPRLKLTLEARLVLAYEKLAVAEPVETVSKLHTLIENLQTVLYKLEPKERRANAIERHRLLPGRPEERAQTN